MAQTNQQIYPNLQIPSSETVYLAIVFGYGDEKLEVHTRRTDNVTFVDQ